MDNKRIKLIAIEMSIAWGVISWVVLLIDEKFWNLGMSLLYTSHSNITVYPEYVNFLFLVLNISCLLSLLVIGIISDSGVRGEFLLYLAFIPQILFYWYIGNIVGRLIVWIKHRKKSSAESTKSTEPI